MPKELKTAAELEALILSDLCAAGIDVAAIEVYGINEPGIATNWSVRRLRLNKTTKVKVEAALKRVVIPLVERYELAAEMQRGI
jgi:hypothetical protein